MQNKYAGYVGKMRGRVPYVFGVVDENGTVLACSLTTETGTHREITPKGSRFEQDGRVYQAFQESPDVRRFVFVDSAGKDAPVYASILAGALEAMMQTQEPETDRGSFIRRAALGQMERSDIYEEAGKLQISRTKPRCAMVVHGAGIPAGRLYDIVELLMVDRTCDFIFMTERGDAAVVREIPENTGLDGMVNFADAAIKTAARRYRAELQAGIGPVFTDIGEIQGAFSQAGTALRACFAYDPVKSLVRSDQMGIAGMPAHMCRQDLESCLSEMTAGRQLCLKDPEMLQTIRCFLANDLSVAKTSRRLFINRSTLVYRLERFEKKSGYDLRKLGDAMTVKMILMVKNCLNFIDSADKRKG